MNNFMAASSFLSFFILLYWILLDSLIRQTLLQQVHQIYS